MAKNAIIIAVWYANIRTIDWIPMSESKSFFSSSFKCAMMYYFRKRHSLIIEYTYHIVELLSKYQTHEQFLFVHVLGVKFNQFYSTKSQSSESVGKEIKSIFTQQQRRQKNKWKDNQTNWKRNNCNALRMECEPQVFIKLHTIIYVK